MAAVSIIIVSWNVRDLLQKCLASLYKHRGRHDLEIFVIDNASHDESVAMIRQHFSDVRVIANTKNVGFARANNQGILQATGDYILLLNPDTEIKQGTLDALTSFMESNPQAGVVGCRHLNTDFTIQKTVRRLPTIRAMLAILTKLHRIMPGLPALAQYFADDFDYKKTQPAEQVQGSCFMIRPEVVAQLGGLDERYFIWFEEVDYCRQVRSAGWEVWYVAEGEIVHHGGQSFAQALTIKKQIVFFRSAWAYFKKFGFTW